MSRVLQSALGACISIGPPRSPTRRPCFAVLLLALASPRTAQPVIDGCPIFPADDIWNVSVQSWPKLWILLTASKRYGLILADNGGDWYVSGVPNPAWNDDDLHQLGPIHANDFEVVDVSTLMLDPNSAPTPHLFSDDFEKGATSLATWTSRVGGAP